jgi:NADH:ubiquinone oxidoreductase subunit
MQETKENSLFTELTSEESASVNGGHYYRDSYYGRENCGRRRRWVVYRRNCDGSFRKVVRYGYW